MYKVTILNNNIPLYAVKAENNIIITRSGNKNFINLICFLLNNYPNIKYVIDYLYNDSIEKACKDCVIIQKKECHECRFKNLLPVVEMLKKELSCIMKALEVQSQK